MKPIITIMLFYSGLALAQPQSSSTPCNGHIDTLTNMEVHYLVDKMSVVEGGMEKLLKDVRMNLKAPAKYLADTKIIVAFIIDKDGKVIGERIIRDIEGSNYALRLLTAVKNNKWVPGTCNGKNVATLQVLPMTIEFK